MTSEFSLINLQNTEIIDAEGDSLFSNVRRRPNLADDVVRQIEQAIIDRRLKPGDHLPTERELGGQFGVSRTVIREAIHSLVAKNLLEVQPGAGTVVCQPSTQNISESIRLLLNIGRPHVDISEMVEVRLSLETLIAGLAAERRKPENVEELARLIDQMAQAETVERFVRHDMAFHLALAEATQNRLYAVLLSSIIEIVVDISVTASDKLVIRERATNHHRRIFEFIRQNDVDGARQAMSDHLVTFEETALHVAKMQRTHTEEAE
jgi:GntR family transcriptional repressor for pyruvate dehydrogenase complex